jgi:glycosyltransferase involved in cell wall biosynthesis
MAYSVSIVIPVFNEKENLNLLHKRITDVMNKMSHKYEIIYIDDGSSDESFEVLKSLKDENTKLIKFCKNFGQTAAIYAGINNSCGDIIITMDADLQNDPADIPNLIETYNKGYDLVSGWRKKRQDNIFKTFPSKIANYLISKITRTGLNDSGCTLKAYNGEILRKINLFADHHRFIPSLFLKYTNKIAEIEVKHHPRLHGKSKYNILRVFRVIIDLIAICYWKKYNNKPMYFWGGLALIFLTISFIAMILLLIGVFKPLPLYLNITYTATFCIFFCQSIILFAIGLLFENMVQISLTQKKDRYYSIEKIL